MFPDFLVFFGWLLGRVTVSRFFAFVLDGNRFLRCIDCIDGEI